MRAITFLALTLTIGSAPPAAAQIVSQPTPTPVVTAESEPWYLRGEPLMYAGNLYYPAGAQVFFNANEMVRSGFYMGVPLYVRTTLEPFSVVFVPISRGLMQPYERPRSGDLAGTAGSRTSNLPVVVATETYQPALMQSIARPEPAAPEPSKVRPVVTASLRTRIGPRPQGINAVFVEFRGRRWYKAGDPVPFDASRMVRIGERAGFPVYGDDAASVKRLFIPVMRDSPMVIEYAPGH